MKIVKLMDHAYPVYVNLDHIVSVRVESYHYDINAIGWKDSRKFSISENENLGSVLEVLMRINNLKVNSLKDNLNN